MEKKRWTVTEAKERFMEMSVEAEAANLKERVADAVTEENAPVLTIKDGLSVYEYRKMKDAWVKAVATFTNPERVESYLNRLQPTLGWDVNPTEDWHKWCVEGFIRTFDKVLDVTGEPVVPGHVRCACSGTVQWEPAVIVCDHVTFGEKPDYYVAPQPFNFRFGHALCAKCEKNVGSSIHLMGYHHYLRLQNSVEIGKSAH